MKKANTIDGWHTKVGYLISTTSFVVWLSTSTTFKMMQGSRDSNPPPRDLFGFSCSNAADALVEKYQNSIVNFNIQCETQVSSLLYPVLFLRVGDFLVSGWDELPWLLASEFRYRSPERFPRVAGIGDQYLGGEEIDS